VTCAWCQSASCLPARRRWRWREGVTVKRLVGLGVRGRQKQLPERCDGPGPSRPFLLVVPKPARAQTCPAKLVANSPRHLCAFFCVPKKKICAHFSDQSQSCGSGPDRWSINRAAPSWKAAEPQRHLPWPRESTRVKATTGARPSRWNIQSLPSRRQSSQLTATRKAPTACDMHGKTRDIR